MRAVKGHNPTWQQKLLPTRINKNLEVVFEVKHHSIWPKPSSLRVAVTDPYPLSALLEMQGGNTFKTKLVASNNIELPPCCDNDGETAVKWRREHQVSSRDRQPKWANSAPDLGNTTRAFNRGWPLAGTVDRSGYGAVDLLGCTKGCTGRFEAI
ncbi:hypothetical protein DFH08DRAFT_810553 [Mycena albidolilacea]|uniref:Uncharacterized protein n=1 Tax=Mycena albidolilacea TaxID=1033008 RepID=A0AAD6ZYE0_9AGAR|nr:hypothetical protein DFH08DRAFT_810553 [Mycena albidolilacea]